MALITNKQDEIMKRIAYLLMMSTAAVQAAEVETLGTISVESIRLSDVSGEEVKSADLAEALVKKVPAVSLVRRSGIANDIILRGQKKDNINILIDGAKIYGACPNRMDPPTSHILTNNIDGIEIIEGPYDVENFGTLSGAVKITTKEPTQELQGEVSVNFGSWDYRKAAATVSGGNNSVRFLLSASKESSAQYEDGDGNNFYEQIAAFNPSPAAVQYKDIYRDLDAYDKRTLLGKLYIDVADNQQVKLSYTANRSDDILYPSSKMDALYDDSDIFTLGYTISNLGEYSKQLDIEFYDSQVEHPMSTFYRNASGTNSVNEVISALDTQMQGLKITDVFDLSADTEVTIGLDTSVRNWDGTYEGFGTNAGITGTKSINDVDTDNSALFAQLDTRHGDVSVKYGLRYDDSSITPAASSGLPSNDYSGMSANVFANYKSNATTQYFGGIGKASRVPDARELYFVASNGSLIGTPTLNETSNTEIDLGVENTYESFRVKTRIFHSWLKDFIVYNASPLVGPNKFENVDATIYGLDVSGAYFINDEMNIDFGLAYLKGEKDEAMRNQTGTNLAEIPPLKLNLALNYDYSYENTARLELVAADAWDEFDAENGEQALDSYVVVNMKIKHDVTHDFELTAGIDNVFDETFAVSNTYKDLTLLVDGTGTVMLMNEPGRYFYVNGTYKF